MERFSHDIGPVVRMARPEYPNEIDEYVNPFCTELDEIGSFQSHCIGHFDLIKSDRLTAEEWEEAKLQLHSKHRPVCIAQDGLPVFDDVGNIHGYAAFLRCINRDARKNSIADEDDNSPYPYHGKVETLAWARSLGWSKRRVSNKNLL